MNERPSGSGCGYIAVRLAIPITLWLQSRLVISLVNTDGQLCGGRHPPVQLDTSYAGHRTPSGKGGRGGEKKRGYINVASRLSAQTQPPSNHDLLRSFLLQQDELEERKRKARSDSSASSASTESFASAFRRHTSAAYGGPSPSPGPLDGVVPEKHVGRRSIVFGRPSSDGARRSLDERPREVGAESVATKFKGRLRALTGGRERSVKPYPGT
ncbi:hypothetical protein BUE80_DR006010 [Diplocarpon rosae]|nr:hypothetical protein BUE80_DR006010 [Diplocarpon rosae]